MMSGLAGLVDRVVLCAVVTLSCIAGNFPRGSPRERVFCFCTYIDGEGYIFLQWNMGFSLFRAKN